MGEKLIPINIEDEMKSSYIDYSMSVIVSRALPDARDGLKPVHRRVLYGMFQLGIFSKNTYKKSARIVGEVLGKYHPHGDISVYDTMVRMSQKWILRYPLIDGQGNFGSLDADPPAAMRYTEVRMKKISEEMLSDIKKDTVDMKLNFDDSLEEPTVLPTRIPNLLINGSSGIAVGMATNIPPHNLKETIKAICAYIDDNNISIEQIIEYIKAPDFPTGGIIYGYDGVKKAFHTGKGRIVLRAKVHFEEIKGRQCIIVDEIPYQVNKSEMINRTVELIKVGKMDGIYQIRDESDRNGLRIVYMLKQNTNSNVLLNNLFKYTSLQTYFNVNNIALVNGKPVKLNIKDLIQHFVDHRQDVIIRRTQYELKKYKDRVHTLMGFLKILDHLDQMIELIKKSKDHNEACDRLIKKFILSKNQSKSILDLRLQSLTSLEINKIKREYEELVKNIENLENVLLKHSIRMKIIKKELLDIKEKYQDGRRTKIDYLGNEVHIEDLIVDEQVVLTISHAGYIKRTSLSEYKCQGRGGVGNRGASARESDFLNHLLIATNHQYLLFFTEKGKCFWLRVYEIPEGSKISKGRAIQNMIHIQKDDKVNAYILTGDLTDKKYVQNHYVMMVTQKGIIKKTSLENYSRPRKDGIKAILIREGDSLLEAILTKGKSHVFIAVKSGRIIRFSENNVRKTGRTSSGVIGINLKKYDIVIGMICVEEEEKGNVLVVSDKGFGKRSNLKDYRITNRGGKGIKTINITKKTGSLISIKHVKDPDDLMIIKKSGIIIRIPISDIRVMGRSTQGVRLIYLKEKDEIADVEKIDKKPVVEFL
ncbi:DNA gyrase subunit A [Blattabacterium punctulatus]|uniref:DNA gyrase subunit A n=1 Tax=Blattabacterium punctulatus TaxID=164514 RepID=A0ABM6WNP2_9FLAO|nr:DNA gyrase subunit A [Blattabacterium punctulatus]AWU39987.1 DNA gyrase subunit A [Blattabacterium punctulatus]AWU40530.1 DNA gyrase subunit A [Blattabacterium punctulatus]AWU42779.1 DNA gyrase subunit A [Blattabacterium punctulatus]AWU46063.1 DNA gyrase subunit A [Blattabacterium punctulatus]